MPLEKQKFFSCICAFAAMIEKESVKYQFPAHFSHLALLRPDRVCTVLASGVIFFRLTQFYAILQELLHRCVSQYFSYGL